MDFICDDDKDHLFSWQLGILMGCNSSLNKWKPAAECFENTDEKFKMFKTTVRMKKCVICSIPLIVAYLAIVHPILLRNEFQQTILDTECKPVWDFLADFRYTQKVLFLQHCDRAKRAHTVRNLHFLSKIELWFPEKIVDFFG